MKSRIPFFILLTGILFFIATRAFIYPLDLWDEMTIYVLKGLKRTFPGEWSPLYTGWYSFLSLWFQDATAIYRLSHGAVLLSNVLAAYFILRSAQIDRLKALTLSTLFLCWIPWSTAIVFVNHFNFTLVLALLLLTRREPFRQEQYLWLGMGLLFLCFNRADNLIPAVGFLALSVFGLYKRNFELSKTRLQWTVAGGLLGIFAVLVKSNSPFRNHRGWSAFRDHYKFHNKETTVSQTELIEASFGNADSIMSAFWTQPENFLDYLTTNLAGIFSGRIFRDSLDFEPLLLLVLIAGLIFLRSTAETEKKDSGQDFSDLKVLALFYLLRTVISVGLFRPLFRYYMEALVLLGLWACCRYVRSKSISTTSQLAYASITSLLIGWAAVDYEAWLLRFRGENQTIEQTVNRLREIPAGAPRSWFPTDAYAYLLGETPKKHRSPYELASIPYPDKYEWIKSVVKEELDVFVFDSRTRAALNRVLGKDLAQSAIRQFTASCYEKLPMDSFASPTEIYYRKSGCF